MHWSHKDVNYNTAVYFQPHYTQTCNPMFGLGP